VGSQFKKYVVDKLYIVKLLKTGSLADSNDIDKHNLTGMKYWLFPVFPFCSTVVVVVVVILF